MNFKDVPGPDPHNSQSNEKQLLTTLAFNGNYRADFIDDGDNFPDDGDLGY